MTAKSNKKMQQLYQFKLLTLFSYQIVLPGCVPEFVLSQPLYSITFIFGVYRVSSARNYGD